MKEDPDLVLDAVAAAIVKARAPGLGKKQWARRAAAAAIETYEALSPPSSGERIIQGLREAVDLSRGDDQPSKVHLVEVKP